MDEFRELLGSRLTERGALARLSEVSGIASHVIGRWRDGIGRPSDTNLKKLAPALGVPYEELARMCGYGLGAGVDPVLDPDVAELVSIYLRVAPEHRPHGKAMLWGLAGVATAVTTQDGGSVNTPGARINARKRPHTPPLKSHKQWALAFSLPVLNLLTWRPRPTPIAATA